jgi:Na+-driven multidrug efflux pump
MNTVWMVLLPLAQQAPDPEEVKAGWIAFSLFLLLAAAVVFLWFSLRKHLGKVNFDEGDDDSKPKPDGDNRLQG